MRYKAESFDQWQYFCAQLYDPLIRCRIDFAGRVDEDVLKRSITESLATIPMMGCCFVGTGRKPYWLDTGSTGEDMVHVVRADSEPEDHVLRSFAATIDISREPQLKINIVRTQDGDVMCVLVSHLVCDSTGFKQYLHILGDIYTRMKRGEPLPGPHRYPRSTKPLYTRTGLLEKIRLLRSVDLSNEQRLKNQRGIGAPSGESRMFMRHRTLSAPEFSSFHASLSRIGASVNDGLMALYARAFCRETVTTHVTLSSTIDWRRFIPEPVAYGITNYAGNCVCDISVEPGDSAADTITQVTDQMRVYKQGDDPLKGALGWDWAIRVYPYATLRQKYTTAVTTAAVTFTNLGILDSEMLDFDALPIRFAYMTASIKPRPYFQVAASTFDGECTLSTNIYGSNEEGLLVDHLLDDIVREARELGVASLT